MALSFARLKVGFPLILQSVFVRPDPKSGKNGIDISHWLLTQRQFGYTDDKEISFRFANDSAEAKVMVGSSQPQDDDVDTLASRMILLQTGGIQKESAAKKKAKLLQNKAEKSSDNSQDAVENDGTQSSQALSVEGKEQESEKVEKIDVSPPMSLTHSRSLDIVAHHTRTKLTFGSDVSPAISGMAKQCQPVFGCSYLAGMWEDTSAIYLLWSSRNPEKHPKLTKWRAPSWSWASSAAAVG